MSDIRTTVQAMLIRALVQRHIFCPLTGKVLDERTCTVILDSDGDPHMVLDPSIGYQVQKNPEALLATGYSLMER